MDQCSHNSFSQAQANQAGINVDERQTALDEKYKTHFIHELENLHYNGQYIVLLKSFITPSADEFAEQNEAVADRFSNHNQIC